jgi:1-phosphatidylinositol-4-phosphate 5-kinase
MGDGAATEPGVRTVSLPAVPQVNGTSPRSHSPGSKPTANGDIHRLSTPGDRAPSFEVNPSSSPANWPLSTSVPDHTSYLVQDSDRLAPPSKRSVHRYSSPPAPSNLDGAQQSSLSSRQPHRHTLQVPRPTPARKSSRDFSDDTYGDRLSPTGGHLRRGSLSLVRRATRTGAGDLHPDEALADDDAARWAEAIKQKRATRKKRREEEDDDRVIVGTKVDQNHVNWVTAYNMLTGIRFVVSRINAKMDRELTAADFEAKHKFSFDVLVAGPLPVSALVVSKLTECV